MLRVIREFQPDWIIGENVAGLINMVLDEVCTDLENEGYEVQPFVIPAVAVNAPHRRDRIWIVAHRHGAGLRKQQEYEFGSKDASLAVSASENSEHQSARDAKQRRSDERTSTRTSRSDTAASHPEKTVGKWSGQTRARWEGLTDCNWSADWLEVATKLCRMDDGLPRRLDRNPRLKALGNAIVPQVAEEIFRAIKKIDG